MPLSGRKRSALNGEEITKLWVKLDSLRMVARFFDSEGKINPSTNRPYTEAALNRAAQRFLVYSPEKARPLYNEAAVRSNAEILTDEQWELTVLRKAIQLFTNNRSGFFRWVMSQKDQWPKKYEFLYKSIYSVEEEDYEYFRNTTRKMPKRSGQINNSEDIQE